MLPHWPAALDGLRVAHLSDIHVGGGMDRERLARVVALTNAAKPDLVVHTGDFLTHRSGEFDAPLYEALARDRGAVRTVGLSRQSRLRRSGAPVAQAGGGRRDRAAQSRRHAAHRRSALGDRRSRLRVRPLGAGGYEALFAPWPQRGAPRLLLNHDPRGFFSLPDACADLVLSGHTHGGHIGMQLSAGARAHASSVWLAFPTKACSNGATCACSSPAASAFTATRCASAFRPRSRSSPCAHHARPTVRDRSAAPCLAGIALPQSRNRPRTARIALIRITHYDRLAF